MLYNADAHAELRELLAHTREYLQQQLAGGRRSIELRAGTWDALNAAIERRVTTPPAPALEEDDRRIPAAKTSHVFEEDDLTRFKSLKTLETFAIECIKCGLCEGRTQVVFGVGNPQAKLVFVGEAPGADEDRFGEPFVGRAGQLLTRIIETMLEPWTRKDVYICNVIKCRPPDNRDPLPAEIESCEPYLIRQLELIQPAMIVGLGKFAVQTLLRDRTGIMKLRGAWRSYHGIPFMPALHPAYILRNPKEGRRMMFEDMKAVRARLREMELL